MEEVNEVVEQLLGEPCPLKTLSDLLSDLLSGMDVSAENISELKNIIYVLEMREEEIRTLRQSVSRILRQYVLAYHAEGIKNRRGKPE